AIQQSLDCFVMQSFARERGDHARPLAVRGLRSTAFEIEEQYDCPLGCIRFAWVLRQRKQAWQPVCAELAQPTSDGRIADIRALRLFSWRGTASQTRSDSVVTLLCRASHWNFIKTQGKLSRHRAILLVKMEG